MADENPQNISQILEKKPFPIFLVFRFSGMGLILLSMIFLFQKGGAPLIEWRGMQLQNGHLGNLLLSLGTGLFIVYLVHKIYKIVKSKA